MQLWGWRLSYTVGPVMVCALNMASRSHEAVGLMLCAEALKYL